MKRKNIKETQYDTGTFQRPDSSGNRGGNSIPKSRPGSGNEFPYDDDSRNSGKITKVKSRNFANMHGAPTPKGIGSDDDRWSATQEAVGVPFNVERGGRGTSATAIPGASGGWAGGFTKNYMPDDELTKASKKSDRLKEYLDGLAVNSNPLKVNPHQDPGNDDDFDNNINIFGNDKNKKRFQISQTPTNLHIGRLNKEMTWRNDIHKQIFETYISLRDTPTDKVENSKHISDVNTETALESFLKSHGEVKNHLSGMSEEEIVDFIIQFDPEHAKKSFSQLGKDKLSSIYDAWANQAREKDNCDDIEEMSERISAFLENINTQEEDY